MIDLSATTVHDFRLNGEVSPLLKGSSGPSRRMGGWLATYGKIGPDGGIVPTVDREDQVFEAAGELGRIDWSGYLSKGRWNDTHDDGTGPKSMAPGVGVIVGLPETLEFHDASTSLAKSHGKVGFWTTGHLFDRADPKSWDGLGRRPTEHEFERADYFWNLSHLLKGLPRTLALSAHGRMATSPCGRRIIYAEVPAAALCEVPMNPDATLEPLELARRDATIYGLLRKGMVGRASCGSCRCPPGACEGLLKANNLAPTILGKPEVDGPNLKPAANDRAAVVDELIKRIAERYFVTPEVAKRWVSQYLLHPKENPDRQDTGDERRT